MESERVDPDPFDVRRARGVGGLLGEFNAAGVLAAADVHVARRLAELADEAREPVVLAAALAVRAPRLGHVHVDLASIRSTAAVDADEPRDLSVLAWPEADGWTDLVGHSELVADGDAEADPRPLRLVGSWLYLDRYWREERQVGADLRALSARAAVDVRVDLLRDGLERMFAGELAGRQCLAAATAVLRRLAVVAGGPGTGKTTTVARVVALLAEQAAAAGRSAPLIALAAPTGKAAARLEQAVHEQAAGLAVSDQVRAELLGLRASTLHRLLGWRPGSHSRFRHHRGQRLPHDVVIVDETSMVSLSLMARLVEAIRPDARLILVGDPGQLASIEAGAVLGDIVGPASDGLALSPEARASVSAATGVPVARSVAAGGAVADGIVVLDRVHRFGGGIARLAEAIRRGDGDAVVEVLASAPDDVTWIDIDVSGPAAEAALAPVRSGAVAAGRAVGEAAAAGRALDAIDALGRFRVLCAHRRGPDGVAVWTGRIEGWLAEAVGGFPADRSWWYAGRPVLVTENDYELRLFNGDTGVVVVEAGAGRLRVCFERQAQVLEFSPTRLGSVETVYAMTIHKSQGSQFDTAAVLLPSPASGILTRELLYTAATRAREHLIIAGAEEAIRLAVRRPVARASGLRGRLWNEP
ncbi:MAG: exodeoxyribonuclease V subunit alpha [Actinobacteria bacterium]|nr:exodeoxyribonuclease V subunit alpha [Actinomycetota bacterium]